MVYTDDITDGFGDLFCSLVLEMPLLCNTYMFEKKSGPLTLKFDEHYETLMQNVISIDDSSTELKLYLTSDKKNEPSSKEIYLKMKMSNEGSTFTNRTVVKYAKHDIGQLKDLFKEENTLFTFYCLTSNFTKIFKIAAKEEIPTDFKLVIEDRKPVKLILELKDLGFELFFDNGDGVHMENIAEEYQQGVREFNFRIHHFYAKRLATFCSLEDGASISLHKTGDFLLMDLFYVNEEKMIDRMQMVIPKTVDLEEDE